MTWSAVGKAISQIGPTVGLMLTAAGLFLNAAQADHNARVASATLSLEMDKRLSDPATTRIVDALWSDPPKPILQEHRGASSELDLEGMLGNYDTVYYLRREKLIDDRLTYDMFCGDLMQAHVNPEVKAYLRQVQQGDPTSYVGFDRLAMTCAEWDKKGGRGTALAR